MGSICNLGAICAEVATVVAGGATLLPGGSGWWVNGNGQVEREGVALLIVGAAEIEGVIEAVLKGSGEKAVFYIAGGGKPDWSGCNFRSGSRFSPTAYFL